MNQGVVDFPVGYYLFPKEIFPTPRSWAHKVYLHIIHWNEVDKGGHFAAFEATRAFHPRIAHLLSQRAPRTAERAVTAV
jgi:hypothetical protein